MCYHAKGLMRKAESQAIYYLYTLTVSQLTTDVLMKTAFA